jgi:hypothetical protein
MLERGSMRREFSKRYATPPSRCTEKKRQIFDAKAEGKLLELRGKKNQARGGILAIEATSG